MDRHADAADPAELPDTRRVLVCLVLNLLCFVEYPVFFMRTGDTGGAISGALTVPYTLTIMLRTVLLVGVAVGLYRRATVRAPHA